MDKSSEKKSKGLDDSPNYPKTSIIILTFNQLAHTKACLSSIHAHTNVSYELVIVDNGSSDGTREYLENQQDVLLISNSENRGFPAGVNQGIHASTGEYLLLLNNDTIVTDGWLQRLHRPLIDFADVGLVGPCSNNVSGHQQIVCDYTDLDGLNKFAMMLAKENEGQFVCVNRLIGFCLLFRRDLVKLIGFFDERFGLGNFEDDDYCLRAIEAGCKAVIVKDTFVHHVGSASFLGNGIDAAALVRHNQQLFEKKWKSAGHSGGSSLIIRRPGGMRPKLSLCMIVRDSSRTLEACLKGIKPFVDEMIIVDTGSLDNTREIALSFGAKVFDFTWCDSFAAARNESLRHATGDWIFWMDADDTIDSTSGQKLRELIARPMPTEILGFVVKVRCPPRNSETIYGTPTLVDHIKVFRNHPEIRFSGRIHEQVLGCIRRLGGDVDWTDIFVEHSGSDVSAEGRERKFSRDIRLLELELNDDPDNTFALFNHGMTLADREKWLDALSALCRSLQLAASGDSHIRKIYALLAQCYAGLGRQATALKTCHQGLAVCPDDPELLFRKGTLEYATGRLAEAEKTFAGLLALRDTRHFASIDQGIFHVKTWHNLALVYESQGNFVEAINVWRKIILHDPFCSVGWWELMSLFLRQKSSFAFRDLLTQVPIDKIPGDIVAGIRACHEWATGNTNACLEFLKRAEGDGLMSDSLLRIACQVAFEAGTPDLAEHWLTALTRIQPQDPSSFQNLAYVYFQRGDGDRAIAAVDTALKLRPDYAASTALRSAILQRHFGNGENFST